MNETTIAHLKSCFPNVEVDIFDKVYFTKESDDTYMFIAVVGAMLDFKIFTKGDYNADTIDRKLFSIVNRYTARTEHIDMSDPYEVDDFVENDVLFREELFVLEKTSTRAKPWIVNAVYVGVECGLFYFLYGLVGWNLYFSTLLFCMITVHFLVAYFITRKAVVQ